MTNVMVQVKTCHQNSINMHHFDDQNRVENSLRIVTLKRYSLIEQPLDHFQIGFISKLSSPKIN